MSGGEPSSIKRDQSMCREGAGSRSCHTEEPFLIFTKGADAACIRRCTASGGPRPSPTSSGRSTSPKRCSRQVAEGRLAHAYLFTGTRGTGKTTCAKILAKAVNCLHPDGRRPLQQVREPAWASSAGALLDVMELDAASQQRRGPCPCAAGGGHLLPLRSAEKAGVHHRRGAHALHRGVQRAAENSGGAAGASDVHSGHHRAAQGARRPFSHAASALRSSAFCRATS